MCGLEETNVFTVLGDVVVFGGPFIAAGVKILRERRRVERPETALGGRPVLPGLGPNWLHARRQPRERGFGRGSGTSRVGPPRPPGESKETPRFFPSMR